MRAPQLAATAFAALLITLATQGCSIAAGALLHPARSSRAAVTPAGCVEETFQGAGIRLRGWRCSAVSTRRGTIVLLHGVADTRASVGGVVRRFTANGLDVIAYDSRAHGESEGKFCTYGYFEKQDLRRIVDGLPPGPVVLMGTSLGGAVALQAAADNPRIAGVVAAEVFADLKTIVRDRTPRFVPDWIVNGALHKAEAQAGFVADEVSPARAARAIRVPVLLVHGRSDINTRPDHSQRVLAALAGPKRLILVDRARHNESLRDAGVWREIDDWVDRLVSAAQ